MASILSDSAAWARASAQVRSDDVVAGLAEEEGHGLEGVGVILDEEDPQAA